MPRDPNIKMAPEAAATAPRAEVVPCGKRTTVHNPKPSTGTIWEAPHGGELIRFSVCEYKGQRYAELRRFYRSGDGWKPSKQGCTMPLWALSELHRAHADYLAANARSETLAAS